MKPTLIVASIAISSAAMAQVHTAAVVDLSDGTITPTLGYTITPTLGYTLKRFQPFAIGKTQITPELWGLGEIVVTNGQKPSFTLGLAAVLGTPISDDITLFIGASSGYNTVTRRLKPSLVFGCDIRF